MRQLETAAVLFDLQNLHHAAKSQFGLQAPGFDLVRLSIAAAHAYGADISSIDAFSGIPSAEVAPAWAKWWSAYGLKLARSGVQFHSTPLRYRDVEVRDQQGQTHVIRKAFEKQTDAKLICRILEIVSLKPVDTIFLFSQDHDFEPLARTVPRIADALGRRVRLVCCYPRAPRAFNSHGIPGFEPFELTRPMLEQALDTTIPFDFELNRQTKESRGPRRRHASSSVDKCELENAQIPSRFRARL